MDCYIDDCERPAKVQGLCGAHYQKKLRHGTPTPDPSTYAKPGPKPDPSKDRSRHNPDNPQRLKPKKVRTEKTHCKHGHELTDANRYWHTTSQSWVCKDCTKAAARKYRETRPSRDLTKCRNGHDVSPENTVTYPSGKSRCRECAKADAQKQRLKKYGLSAEQFSDLMTKQDGHCAICPTPLAGGRGEHIDHDHVTGEVRAILCHACNTGLGHFKDSPELLIKAAEYLLDSWRSSP